MRRVWNWAGKYDLTRILLPVIAVMIGIALLTGGQHVPTPVPDNEVILVIPPGYHAPDDLSHPYGFWVEAKQDLVVRVRHEGDASVKLRVTFWTLKDGIIEIDSVLPFSQGDELTVKPQPWQCDGIFVKASRKSKLVAQDGSPFEDDLELQHK